MAQKNILLPSQCLYKFKTFIENNIYKNILFNETCCTRTYIYIYIYTHTHVIIMYVMNKLYVKHKVKAKIAV